MIKIIFLTLISFIFSACQGGGAETPLDESASLTMVQPFAVYNAAYQENYTVDNINDILLKAKNAYILVDTFSAGLTAQNVAQLQTSGNEVGAYISVGTGERYRDDFSLMEPYLSAIAWSQWPDEYFVSETTTGIISVMKSRIDKIADIGVDWVEFDNMDWLTEQRREEYNLHTSQVESKTYINALCDHAHSKGLKCMAKNVVDGFDHFDGVLYESYNDQKNWWDATGTRSFISAGKPVIINHYNEDDCDAVYEEYKSIYGNKISFICEDKNLKRYKHYNE